jgi:MFS family permease
MLAPSGSDLVLSHRVNISNAALFNLKTDLHIETGTKYNTALTIFFVPYILFEVPSNVLLKKLKPHVWCMFSIASDLGDMSLTTSLVSFCMFMFGLVMICQGLVSSWGGLMTARFFLGVFETGMFPGCEYCFGQSLNSPKTHARQVFI